MSNVDELNILMPEQSLSVAGATVTVHEYTFAEQLQHRALLRPVIDAVAGLFDGTDADGVKLDDMTDALAAVYDPVISVVAIACGQPREWVAALSGEDSEKLFFTWWGVNASFFIRQATLPQMQKLVQSLSAGVTSLPR